MTSLHPDWQSTDGEQPVPVRSARSEATHAPVSRAPAALVGIALILGVAAFSFGGVRGLLGQLAGPTPDVTIRLTPTGPDPDPAVVEPGNVVRILNEDQIPHVLSSDDLPTADGTPFETPGIFAGGDYVFTVPASAADGTYAYISQTNPEFSGEIIVGIRVAATGSSVSSAAPQASSVPPLPVIPGSSAAPLPLPTSSRSSVSPSPLPAGVIAVNPHVVGARSSGSAGSRKPTVTQHKPGSNTESGPETWIVLACAAGALVLASRGAFRRV